MNNSKSAADITDSNVIREAQESIDSASDASYSLPNFAVAEKAPENGAEFLTQLRAYLHHPRRKKFHKTAMPMYISGSQNRNQPVDLDVRLGRFHVRRQLGSGGFGIVFAAYDPRLKREIALKLPRLNATARRGFRRRVLREARLAAHLDHSGIVPVFEAGRIGPFWYIASALCSGPNLHEWSRQRAPVPTRMAVEIVLQIVDAVEHAHSRGVLHRDIKPSNVLLKFCDSPSPLMVPTAQLTDFGLASRVIESPNSSDQGRIAGTIAFMAPEQTFHDANQTSILSDVYSLGAVLYDLIAGKPPFCQDDISSLIEAVRDEHPKRLYDLRRDVSKDLDSICQKCLSKDPSLRYLSAHDLAADLRRFLSGHCVVARPVSYPVHALRWSRRKPLVASLLIVLACSFFGSFVFLTAAWRSEKIARTHAEARYHTAKKSVNDTYVQFATKLLSGEPRKEALRKEFLQKALAFYEEIAQERQFDDESSFDLQVALHEIANLTWQLGEQELSQGYRTRCLLIINELICRDDKNSRYRFARFHNLMLLGGEQKSLQNHDEALTTMRQAQAEISQLASEYPSNSTFQEALVSCKLSLASLLTWNNENLEPAKEILNEAILIAETLHNATPKWCREKHLTSAYRELGLISELEQNSSNAEEFYAKSSQHGKALVELDSTVADHRYIFCEVLAARARASWNTGNYAESRRYLDEAIGHVEKLMADFPSISKFSFLRGRMSYDQGVLCWESGQIEEARGCFQMGLNHLETLLVQYPDAVSFRPVLVSAYTSCPDLSLRNVERANELSREHSQESSSGR